MQITRKHHPIEFTYKLLCANGEAVIERTEQEHDLGVWTTSNLSWSKQVSEQCVRGNKMLGYIKRSTHNIKSLAARRTLYLSLVRPQLGYAAQVWAPQSIELIARLEQIQRRALKYILDLSFITNTTYSQRLSQLQLLPLTYWHEYLDLIFFFKCVNGIIDVNNETSPKPAQFLPSPTKPPDPLMQTASYMKPNCAIHQHTKNRSSLEQFEPGTR